MSVTAKKKADVYFTDETEKAIIQYNHEKNEILKNRIYRLHIREPFTKIVDHLYNRYFSSNYFQVPPEDIKAETLSYLSMQLPKYSVSKGKGHAFGYFSVIAKNYMMYENKKAFKAAKTNYYIDTYEEFDVVDDEYDVHETHTDMINYLSELVSFWEKNVTDYFTTEKDLKIANSIIQLVKSVNKIDNLSKKAIYWYLREMTNEKTIYITSVMNKMQEVYIETHNDLKTRCEFQQY